MKELLEYIVKSLVSEPEEVKIEEEVGDNLVSFNLTVNPKDMGIIIGKLGHTIRAIRRLLVTRAMAENPDLTVRVNLQEVK